MFVTIAPLSSLQVDLSQEMHVQNTEQLHILWKKGKNCRSGICGTEILRVMHAKCCLFFSANEQWVSRHWV